MREAAPIEGKRHEIVTWAFERFYEGGFHAMGVDEVMAGSGISKRTLYKYFPSREALIGAVLDHYGEFIMHELFDSVAAVGGDPRQRIVAFFDIRKAMADQSPTRGCLGVKAALEYAVKDRAIVAQGKSAPAAVEQRLVEMCREAGFADPTALGKEINVLFQGALLLSQVFGDSSPFVSAKAALLALLDRAAVAPRPRGKRAAN
uniref:TetR-family transcriptional regulator n=1 Tax=Bradyrhizobium sp. HWK12 TaxID=244563 RepID=E2RV65_9BRAD|nr:TetR-family transcriptional regulator [Bradyrhizobium sp. HWK12]